METNKILDADILDLVFDGRNKEYGAYDLRKHYNGRLGRSIAVTSGVVVVLFCFGFVGKGRHTVAPLMMGDTVTLVALPDVVPPPPPPPVIPKAQPPVAMKIFTTPLVVTTEPPDDEKPPINDDLINVKIGTVNSAGAADDGTNVAPPLGAGTGLVEPPKKEVDDNGFVPVEKESEFPGGPGAWLRYLNHNLSYPEEALNTEVQGVVQVRFIVDKDGNVSDVEAISGPTEGGLRNEAVRVIKKSGKWTPALQNGRYVKSYKVQPVTFRLGDQ